MTFSYRKITKGTTGAALDPRTRRSLSNLALGGGDTDLLAELFDGQRVVIRVADDSVAWYQRWESVNPNDADSPYFWGGIGAQAGPTFSEPYLALYSSVDAISGAGSGEPFVYLSAYSGLQTPFRTTQVTDGDLVGGVYSVPDYNRTYIIDCTVDVELDFTLLGAEGAVYGGGLNWIMVTNAMANKVVKCETLNGLTYIGNLPEIRTGEAWFFWHNFLDAGDNWYGTCMTLNYRLDPPEGIVLRDDTPLYFGDAGDIIVQYDSANDWVQVTKNTTASWVWETVDTRWDDGQKAIFGTDADAEVYWDVTGSGSLLFDTPHVLYDAKFTGNVALVGSEGQKIYQGASGEVIMQHTTAGGWSLTNTTGSYNTISHSAQTGVSLYVYNGYGGTPSVSYFIVGGVAAGTLLEVDSGGALVSHAARKPNVTVTSSTTYAVTSTDHIIVCNNATFDQEVDLPAATGSERELTISNRTSGKTVTVDQNGTDTIDGVLTAQTLEEGEAIKLIDYASGDWAVI